MNIKKYFAIYGMSLCLVSAIIGFKTRSVRADNNIGVIRLMALVNDIRGESLEFEERISREEFSKMLISFMNENKSLRSLSGKNIYKDVKKTDKYRAYINAAGMKGYMRGYLTGKFERKKPVTMGMAAYSSLKILGYKDAELLPLGELEMMDLFNSLGLNKNINKNSKDKISGRDCLKLFSNLVRTNRKDGDILGKRLGYQFNAEGNLDLEAFIKKKTDMRIAQIRGAAAMIGRDVDKVYRNDKLADLNSIERHDLLYYNRSTKTVYAYSDRVYGQLSDIQPSFSAAKSVVISGKPYELAEKPISSKSDNSISGLNLWRAYFNNQNIEVGTFVIGIKDLDGKIIAFYKQKAIENNIIGYVLGNESRKTGDGKGGFKIENMMILATTAGERLEVPNPDLSIREGDVVRVIYSSEQNPLILSENSSGGSLNGKGGLFSDDLRVIEVGDGDFASVLPGAVKNLDLTKVNARYIGYNAKGEITDLILKDVLGAVYRYGIVTDNLGSSISYLHKGEELFAAYDFGWYFDLSNPVAAFGFKGKKLNSVKSLKETVLSRIDKNLAFSSDGKNYLIADDVDVYYRSFGEWKYDSFKDMEDISGHRIKGYYPGNSSMIRILIIEK